MKQTKKIVLSTVEYQMQDAIKKAKKELESLLLAVEDKRKQISILQVALNQVVAED